MVFPKPGDNDMQTTGLHLCPGLCLNSRPYKIEFPYGECSLPSSELDTTPGLHSSFPEPPWVFICGACAILEALSLNKTLSLPPKTQSKKSTN
jgi:hypothetical protein